MLFRLFAYFHHPAPYTQHLSPNKTNKPYRKPCTMCAQKEIVTLSHSNTNYQMNYTKGIML